MATDATAQDQPFLDEQRRVLLEERETEWREAQALDSEANALARRRETEGSLQGGFGTGETTSVDLQRVRGAHEQVVRRLGEIDAALARIAAGTYGRCESCGGPIGRDRLQALPTATRCIRCQTPPRGL